MVKLEQFIVDSSLFSFLLIIYETILVFRFSWKMRQFLAKYRRTSNNRLLLLILQCFRIWRKWEVSMNFSCHRTIHVFGGKLTIQQSSSIVSERKFSRRKWKTFLLLPSLISSSSDNNSAREYKKRSPTDATKQIFTQLRERKKSPHIFSAQHWKCFTDSSFWCVCFIVDERENSFFPRKREEKKGHKNILRQRRDVQMSYNSMPWPWGRGEAVTIF